MQNACITTCNLMEYIVSTALFNNKHNVEAYYHFPMGNMTENWNCFVLLFHLENKNIREEVGEIIMHRTCINRWLMQEPLIQCEQHTFSFFFYTQKMSNVSV